MLSDSCWLVYRNQRSKTFSFIVRKHYWLLESIFDVQKFNASVVLCFVGNWFNLSGTNGCFLNIFFFLFYHQNSESSTVTFYSWACVYSTNLALRDLLDSQRAPPFFMLRTFSSIWGDDFLLSVVSAFCFWYSYYNKLGPCELTLRVTFFFFFFAQPPPLSTSLTRM